MNFKHIISLGFFCDLALEIERLGYRDGSYPFDWCISKDWVGLQNAITGYFKNYLEYDAMAQSKEDPTNYKNDYNIQFFHDFTKYKKLEKQLSDVQKKYDRRIKRFYESIKEPTLFIRVINDEKSKEELCYWNNNIIKLELFLQSFCKDNKIIFIADSSFKNKYKNISVYYFKEKDDEEFNIISLSQTIQNILSNISYDKSKREENYKFYENKKIRNEKSNKINNSLFVRLMQKIYVLIKPIQYHTKKY